MFTPSFHIDTYDCILDIASVLLTDIVQGAGLALQTQVSQAETHLRCLWSPVALNEEERLGGCRLGPIPPPVRFSRMTHGPSAVLQGLLDAQKRLGDQTDLSWFPNQTLHQHCAAAVLALLPAL